MRKAGWMCTVQSRGTGTNWGAHDPSKEGDCYLGPTVWKYGLSRCH